MNAGSGEASARPKRPSPNREIQALAQIPAPNVEALAWLEALLHPRVVAHYLAWREALGESRDPPAAAATEVPLLYEVGGESRFDVVVVITAPEDVRRDRALVAGAKLREARLLPDEEKVERADFAYVNDGTRQELDDFVAETMRTLETR